MKASTALNVDERLAEFQRQQDWLLGLITDPEGRRYLKSRDPSVDFAQHSSRLRSFLSEAGCPQDQFRSVHVAGTSGKGSVSTLCAALLSACGQRTAVHTSPYLQICNEKLQLDGLMIQPSGFVELTRRFREIYASWSGAGPGLRYDQAWAALTFLWFARQGADWGVVETGVGGRYDPTNVLASELAIITNVDLDHMDVLGDTITEVAGHKAGIIKAGGRVVTAASDRDALAVIENEVKHRGARLRNVTHEVSAGGRLRVDTPDRRFDEVEVPLKGSFQYLNAATAISAVDWLAQDFGFEFPRAVIEPALEGVRFPGRFEVVQRRPTVILDGAHNPHKMRSLAASFESNFPGRRATVIMGMIAGKSVEETLLPLLPIARSFGFADFRVFGKPSMPARTLRSLLAALSPKMPCYTAPTVLDAVRHGLDGAGAEDIVLITGSIYFLGQARERWYPKEEMLRSLEGSASVAKESMD